ncbi:MAG: phage integrase N-terminal SAM-like domain-containing protein [Chloroflexota bacterium]
MMDNTGQRELFAEPPLETGEERRTPPLTPDASLQAALGTFEKHMQDEGFSINTVKAFASDIRLLGRYMGIGTPIGEIGTKNLNDFMNWLLHERGVPCSPKSYARRVTTLKVFFGWLSDSGVLPQDPSAAVIQQSVSSPLPEVPRETDLDKALAVTEAWREGDGHHKPDARPHLLLNLLLQTAVKKGEALAIVPNHIDATDEAQPVLYVRYANPRLRYKERKVPLEPAWLEILDEYIRQYQPDDTLFTCTARNLEYILHDIAEAADIAPGLLSFENLRWASALRDWRENLEQDDIRQKLGLSKIAWRETKTKLRRLAEQQQMEMEAV